MTPIDKILLANSRAKHDAGHTFSYGEDDEIRFLFRRIVGWLPAGPIPADTLLRAIDSYLVEQVTKALLK